MSEKTEFTEEQIQSILTTVALSRPRIASTPDEAYDDRLYQWYVFCEKTLLMIMDYNPHEHKNLLMETIEEQIK